MVYAIKDSICFSFLFCILFARKCIVATSWMSTFETLPDEILMIIVRYSGNAYTVFRTYSGLNQRLNNILVDRRLHLFTELLYTNINDPDIRNY